MTRKTMVWVLDPTATRRRQGTYRIHRETCHWLFGPAQLVHGVGGHKPYVLEPKADHPGHDYCGHVGCKN
jgi:hypothetical protein